MSQPRVVTTTLLRMDKEDTVENGDAMSDASETNFFSTGTSVGATTIIQEEIETITTFEGPPDLMSLREEDSSSIVSHRSYISGGGESSSENSSHVPSHLLTNHYDLNLNSSVLKVPFPELGVDVVDINYSSLFSEEEKVRNSSSSQIRLTDVQSWDDNWLFKKHQKKGSDLPPVPFSNLHFISGPVNMYIPNPSSSQSPDPAFLEDLEELSDRASVHSLAFSTDSEESESQPKEDETPAKPAVKVTPAEKDTKSKSAGVQTSPSSDFLSFLQSQDSNQINYSIKGKREDSLTRGQTMTGQSRQNSFLGSNSPCSRASTSPCVSDSQVISQPCFVPLNRRVMENSRSDPCFVIKPCGASVQPNIVVQFCCRVKGSRPLGVAWFKGDLLLSNDDTFRIFSSGNEFVMEIKGTQLDHNDTYSCVVYNGNGEQWCDFMLVVSKAKEKAASPPPQVLAAPPVKAALGVQKSPVPIKIVTRTWAERNASLCEVPNNKKVTNGNESESIPRGVNCSSATQKGKSPSGNGLEAEVSSQCKTMSAQVVKTGHPVTREAEVTSERLLVYSSPSPKANRGESPSSAKRPDQINGRPQVAVGDWNGKMEESNNNGPDHDALLRSGKQKMDLSKSQVHLSAYKRDYFVPDSSLADDCRHPINNGQLDESMNGLEEKVYESSRFFTLPGEGRTRVTDAILKPDNRESELESLSSRKCSSHDEGVAATDETEDEDDRPRENPVRVVSPSAIGPSVRKLVRKFSQKDCTIKRRSTFTSNRSIHEEGRGSGIHKPRMNSAASFEVHSLTARSMKKEFREKNSQHFPRPMNRLGSTSLYDIDQLPKSLSPGSGSSDGTGTTESPTNDGYVSDESNFSDRNKFSGQIIELSNITKIESSCTKISRKYW